MGLNAPFFCLKIVYFVWVSYICAMTNYIKADGFDEAIIGIDMVQERIIYCKQKMVDILVNDGMEWDDSVEYLEHNTWCAYIGEHTPIYMDQINIEQLTEMTNGN